MNIRPWLSRTILSVLASVVFLPLFLLAQSPNQQNSRITQAIDESKLVALRGNVHPMARSKHDVGTVSDAVELHRMLLLLKRSPAQEAALQQRMIEQQDPSSPNYRHWLTPEEFGQSYGPSETEVQTVALWLESHGFSVDAIHSGRTVLEFSGNVAQLRDTFHTEMHQYQAHGIQFIANAQNPSIPLALAAVVAGPVRLNSYPSHQPQNRVGQEVYRSKKTGQIAPASGDPQFTFPYEGATGYGLSPADFSKIYNVAPLWNIGIDGTGQSIAIVGEETIHVEDARAFRQIFGLPAKDPVVIYAGQEPDFNPYEELEAMLDVEWSGAVAKNATIKYVAARPTDTTAGIDLAALYIVDNNVAPIMSESYAACEAQLGQIGNQFYSTLWEQAAAEGISVFVASADNGTALCQDYSSWADADGISVNALASTPFNVAVGGTDFDDINNQSAYWNATNDPNTGASVKSYIPETTWNDSCAASGLLGCSNLTQDQLGLYLGGGGSGGPSSCVESTGTFDPYNSPDGVNCIAGYPKPSWQKGPGVPKDGVRDLPDVSLFAAPGVYSHSFYLICFRWISGLQGPACTLSDAADDLITVGGTSASSPSFAGIQALVNQLNGSRQGNPNPVYYQLAQVQKLAGFQCNSSSTSGSPLCIFHDVTKGNNSQGCQGGTPNCSVSDPNSYGVLVDANGNPAYTAVPGYDMATGLGSVNAANLVYGWGVGAAYDPTTTTLALSPATAKHGTPLNISIQVKSKANGAATGDVALTGIPSNGNDIEFSLSNGMVNSTTAALPGGSYKVTAHYAGDGIHQQSNSSPVSVQITPEFSKAKVSVIGYDANGNTVPVSSITYGDFLMGTRVDVAGLSGQGNATGTVTLTDNGKNWESALALNSQGTANFLASSPQQAYPAGANKLVATYGGDPSFNASTSAAFVLTVANAPTTISVQSSASPAKAGTSVTFTATVISNVNNYSAEAPGGTVKFYSNGKLIPGTVTLTPITVNYEFYGITATLTTTVNATENITATFTGDSNYAGSTSAPVTVTVR